MVLSLSPLPLVLRIADGVETRCGLGKHVLAATPEQFMGLLKVRLCSAEYLDAGDANTLIRPSPTKDRVSQSA